METSPPHPAKPKADAAEVLRSLEWSGWQNTGDGRTLPCCPVCRRFEMPVDGRRGWIQRGSKEHAPGCRLAASLAPSPSDEATVLRGQVEALQDLLITYEICGSEQNAEITAVRAERDAALKVVEMSVTAGAVWTKRAEIAEARNKVLEEALRPFALWGAVVLRSLRATAPDDDAVDAGCVNMLEDYELPCIGDLRRARAALSQDRTEVSHGGE